LQPRRSDGTHGMRRRRRCGRRCRGVYIGACPPVSRHHLRIGGQPGSMGPGMDRHERDRRLPSDAPARTLAPHIIPAGRSSTRSAPHVGTTELRVESPTLSILAAWLHPKIPHPNLHPFALVTLQIHEIYSTLGKGIEYTPSTALRDEEARVRRSNRRSADEIASRHRRG